MYARGKDGLLNFSRAHFLSKFRGIDWRFETRGSRRARVEFSFRLFSRRKAHQKTNSSARIFSADLLRLPNSLAALLKDMAKTEDRTVSVIIKRILADYFDKKDTVTL